MADKKWKPEKIKYKTEHCLKIWKRLQQGIQYTVSPVSYAKLKAKRKGKKLDVIEAVKKGVVKNFKVIESDENHHAIIDKYSQVLGYRYHIKPELLDTLSNSTLIHSQKRRKTNIRSNYLI